MRWGIIVDRQLLFATNNEDLARRFMAMGFQVFDHSTGYYAYMDHRKTDSRDLLSEDDYLYYGQGH